VALTICGLKYVFGLQPKLREAHHLASSHLRIAAEWRRSHTTSRSSKLPSTSDNGCGTSYHGSCSENIPNGQVTIKVRTWSSRSSHQATMRSNVIGARFRSWFTVKVEVMLWRHNPRSGVLSSVDQPPETSRSSSSEVIQPQDEKTM